MNQLGFQLEIKVKDVEEVSSKIELTEKIKDISYKKVIEVAKENRTSFVVGADTLVEIGGEVLGKPNDENQAREMLKKLSGKEHRVITAYTLINLEKNINISEAIESKVFFKTISSDEIDWYIESREPMDKAGAYGIQGLGAIFVDKIEGDFFSIMGFPINHFVKTLKKLGINIKDIQKI